MRQTALRDEYEASMNQYWDVRSESYSEMNRKQLSGDRRDAWEQMIFSHVEEERPLKVLDIGTGPGFFAILAALRGHQVTAVDMNAEMLEQAQRNAQAAGADIRFVQVGHTMPFEENSFDLILSRDVTWTLTAPEEQLQDWGRLLKPGGRMLYFDAEWYYHLKNRQNRMDWESAKADMAAAGISFYAKAGEMEEIAAGLPMTYEDRPRWDGDFWARQGYACSIYENLNEAVYNQEERIRYQAHPMFLVEVRGKDASYQDIAH